MEKILYSWLNNRWLRGLVMLLILALLAYQLSLLFWHYYPGPGAHVSSQLNPIKRVNASSPQTANHQQQAKLISSAFLFDKPVAAVVMAVAEEAPETQLNYKLRGIYYSLDPNIASAIIEVQANKSQSYQLDDELAEKITLASIEESYVLINRYGKLERLNLQKTLPANGDISSERTSGIGATPSQSALLRSYKKRYASNPMALATRFQAIPVQQDGRNIGFKLKSLRGESLLRKLEFEGDDIFTAVNGVGLSNPFEAIDALKSLNTADRVSVTFMRNGSEQTLDFKL